MAITTEHFILYKWYSVDRVRYRKRPWSAFQYKSTFCIFCILYFFCLIYQIFFLKSCAIFGKTCIFQNMSFFFFLICYFVFNFFYKCIFPTLKWKNQPITACNKANQMLDCIKNSFAHFDRKLL